MSLIQCTSDCNFQQDGYCHLERVGHMTNATLNGKSAGCLYYQPKTEDVQEMPGRHQK